MAKMLDRPAPEGARSVSWPWYHHVLTNELTLEVRAIFEGYSGVRREDIESHIYSIVSTRFTAELRPMYAYINLC